MAAIPRYTPQVNLNPGSVPQVSLTDPVGAALQDVGGSVSDLAASIIDRQQKQEDFKANNDYQNVQMQLADQLQQQTDAAPEDGTGLHDNFMAKTYQPTVESFLGTLPDRVKQNYETMLGPDGADTTKWSIAAATNQRNANYNWQADAIDKTTQQMATGISTNPAGYDDYVKSGEALIQNSTLPTPAKTKLMDGWHQLAMTSNLDQMLKKDPQSVLRNLGVDARQLTPTTLRAMLSQAVQTQESGNNPGAVSAKGATGLMQIMPGTARDIAKQIGDKNFPAGENDTVVGAYMSNPVINKQYGNYYLGLQLRTFANTRNPIETALVAYNAGPQVAQQWVESGYDDSMLPKETQNYKNSIMAKLTSPGAKGNPDTVQFQGLPDVSATPGATGTGSAGADAAAATGGAELDPANAGVNIKAVNTDLKNRVADAFATVGINTVKVTSGYRDPVHNAAVGGVEDSQHITGNAMDIDVSGYSHTQRNDLIKALSAAGVTGIGVGSNIIHADMGGRRAWGYNTDGTPGKVPAWAQATVNQHLAGAVAPPASVSNRYAQLPYDTRQKYVTSADTAVTAQSKADDTANVQAKLDTRKAMNNEVALYGATGQGSPGFDESAISTVLGPDDYAKYVDKKDTAQKTYQATNDIETMAPDDMQQRHDDYEPIPGSDDFQQQQQVQKAVDQKITAVTTLRAKHPDQAALAYPDVSQLYDKMLATIPPDQPNANPDPTVTQQFIQHMMDRQAEFGVPVDARAPIPRDWALRIGSALTKLPSRVGTSTPVFTASVVAAYKVLEQTFGSHTDDVILYALSEYKGLDPNTSKLVAGYMKAMQIGGDPLRLKPADQALDQSQQNGFLSWLGDFSSGRYQPPPGSPSAPAAATGLTPEEQLRQRDAASQSQ